MTRFLRTKLATDWSEETSILRRAVGRILSAVIPQANPDYSLGAVRVWLVEFDDAGVPWREVGLDAAGEPVVGGPDDRNYGFWCDTNMRFDDFKGEEVDAQTFEAAWRRWCERCAG